MAYVTGRHKVKKKTGRKKKRTAAQKRATANLVKLNKQRAKKKVAKKKVVRRKVATRKANPASRNYRVFKIRGKGDLYFLTIRGAKPGWTLTAGDAITFAHKTEAVEVAKQAERKWGGTWFYGVAPTGKGIATIVAEFEKQTGKK